MVQTFVTASSVHVFKEVYQRTNLSQKTYKASSGMEGERLHVVFGLTGICIDIYNGENLKSFSLKRRDPQLIDVCLMVTNINPAIHAPVVYTSLRVIS